MNVVGDASPLVNLARIESLSLLPGLYGEVSVPEAVWQEVVVEERGKPGAQVLRDAAWLNREDVSNRDLVRALCQELDAGEAEAIALAVETESALLLMDEQHGRETAAHFDLAFVGLVGVLTEAKESGHINAVRPYLEALREKAGFWISDALYRRVLRDVKEHPK